MQNHANPARARVVIILAALLMGTVACNTVKGLGEDIESVGKKGEEVID